MANALSLVSRAVATLKQLEMRHKVIPPYRPQTNGKAE
jgi:hypothetical protein